MVRTASSVLCLIPSLNSPFALSFGGFSLDENLPFDGAFQGTLGHLWNGPMHLFWWHAVF